MTRSSTQIMTKPKSNTIALIVRGVLALSAIFTLLIVFAKDVFPSLSIMTVLGYASLGLICIVAFASMLIIVKAHINQFILKHGGIDPAWLWFNRNPAALEQRSKQSH